MKTMCLIIPTKGRPDAINAYLASQAYIAGQLGIDILIQDSSESDETRKIVEKWKNSICAKLTIFIMLSLKKSIRVMKKSKRSAKLPQKNMHTYVFHQMERSFK